MSLDWTYLRHEAKLIHVTRLMTVKSIFSVKSISPTKIIQLYIPSSKFRSWRQYPCVRAFQNACTDTWLKSSCFIVILLHDDHSEGCYLVATWSHVCYLAWQPHEFLCMTILVFHLSKRWHRQPSACHALQGHHVTMPLHEKVPGRDTPREWRHVSGPSFARRE